MVECPSSWVSEVTNWTCNMSKTQTRLLNFRFEINYYHNITSRCCLTYQPNKSASWDFPELAGKTLSLALQLHFETFELGTSNGHLTTIKKGPTWKWSHSEAIKAQRWRKRIPVDFIWILEYIWAQRLLDPLNFSAIWERHSHFHLSRFEWLLHPLQLQEFSQSQSPLLNDSCVSF